MNRYGYDTNAYTFAGRETSALTPEIMPVQQTNALLSEVARGMNNLNYSHHYLGQQMSAMSQEVGQTMKSLAKVRKKLVDWEPSIMNNGCIQLIGIYSNGERIPTLLTGDVCGDFKIAILSCSKYNCSFYSIVYPKVGISILDEISNIKPKGLYEAFVRADVKFNHMLATSVVERALYQLFAAKIKACKCSIEISGLAGWEDGKFKDAKDFEYLESFKPNMPVMKMHFSRDEPSKMWVDDYSLFLDQIRFEETKVFFSILPMAGIINSLLKERKLVIPLVINLILMTEGVSVRDIAEYLQVFNRSEIEIRGLEASEKQTLKAIEESKDELLLFAGLTGGGESRYYKDKVTRKLHMLAQKAVMNEVRCNGQSLKSLILTISDQYLPERNVRNVYIDENTILHSMNEEAVFLPKSIDAAFFCFVDYVETHMKDVIRLMDREYGATTKEERYWRIVLAIVESFWKQQGVSLKGILHLSEEFTYEFLWKEEDDNVEDDVEMMISAVRGIMQEIVPVSRSMKDAEAGFIYDDKSIWISLELFEKALEKRGIIRRRNSILLQCREKGLLKSNQSGGFATRLQIANKRKNFYCFCRESFNKAGMADIISLGREKTC